uniref:Uncharacterized protein n=1 Tax=Panagrolaimus sp. JU765 TaxID=591449 RepID=A0AC34RHX4_9BILA
MNESSEVLITDKIQWNFLFNTFDYDSLGDKNIIIIVLNEHGEECNEIFPIPGQNLISVIRGIDEIVNHDCLEAYPPICSDAKLPYRNSNIIIIVLNEHGEECNEIFPIPGQNLISVIRGIDEIVNHDCLEAYPPICSDSKLPYRNSVCLDCVNIRSDCQCNNPLRRSDAFQFIHSKNCSLDESIKCLNSKYDVYKAAKRRQHRRSLCPTTCTSRSFDMTMTILNFRGQLLNDPKIRPNAMGNLNKVVQALDNIEAIFPGNRHAMWSAIEFLQPLMEDFYKFFNNMLILGFKDE